MQTAGMGTLASGLPRSLGHLVVLAPDVGEALEVGGADERVAEQADDLAALHDLALDRDAVVAPAAVGEVLLLADVARVADQRPAAHALDRAVELAGLHAVLRVGEDRALERDHELAAGGELLGGAGGRRRRLEAGGAPAHRALLAGEALPLGRDPRGVLACASARVGLALGVEHAGEDQDAATITPASARPARIQRWRVGDAREAAVVALAAARAEGALGDVGGAAAGADARRRLLRSPGEDLPDVVDCLRTRIHCHESYNV